MKADNEKKIHIRHSMGGGGITTFVQSLLDLNSHSNTVHDILVWKESVDSYPKYNIIDISKSPNRKKEFDTIIKGYDKIFVHSLMPFMLWSLFKRKQDVFLFQHGITFGKGKKKLFKRLYYFLIINFFGFKVICSSKFAKKKLLSKVPVFNKKLLLIINFGINMDLKSNRVSDGDSVLRIGFAGRLVNQKKVSRIINALAIIKDNVAVEFHIAGDGPLLNKLKAKSKEFENSKTTFVFHGFLNDMDDFYSKLDVFILPSVGESFGLVVLEALARKIPTIVFSDSGACVEFIEHEVNGYVVTNELELSQKIEALSDSAFRNELQLKMSTMDMKNYDISNTRAKLDVL